MYKTLTRMCASSLWPIRTYTLSISTYVHTYVTHVYKCVYIHVYISTFRFFSVDSSIFRFFLWTDLYLEFFFEGMWQNYVRTYVHTYLLTGGEGGGHSLLSIMSSPQMKQ